MSVQIKGGKLLRLNYIIANQSDRLRLIAKLKQGYAEADAIKVNDLGGLTFEYKPFFGEEARNPLRIPKKLVEEYNAQLVEEANINEEDAPDFDSLEVLKGQLDYWVEQAVGGESIVFTENDIVAIEAVAGKVDFGRFVYSYAQNGLLDNTIIGRQKRFTSTRANIATKIEDITAEEVEGESKLVEITNGVVIINSLNPSEIIEALISAIGNPEVSEIATWEDFNTPVLFPEDIWLPVTHFKSGQTYTANIQSTALDYFGQIEFQIFKPEIAPMRQFIFTADNPQTERDGLNFRLELINGSEWLTNPANRLFMRPYGSGMEYASFSLMSANPGPYGIALDPINESFEAYEVYATIVDEGVSYTSEVLIVHRPPRIMQ